MKYLKYNNRSNLQNGYLPQPFFLENQDLNYIINYKVDDILHLVNQLLREK